MTITITTNPDPIVAGSPATVYYTNTDITPIVGDHYQLKNALGKIISHLAKIDNNTFIFDNSILDNGLNIIHIYHFEDNINIVSFPIDISTICFKEGTQILAYVTKDQETYVPIEQITDNMFIKTYKHGFKKVKYIMKSRIINSSERSINKLYKMSKSANNNLIEDLYITGAHAVLYDTIGERQKEQMNKLSAKFDMDYSMKIDGKCKLIAYYDNNFEECNEDCYFNIYHLVLESDKPDTNYGIYANGILVESTDEITLVRMNNYSLINSGFEPVDTKNKKGLSFRQTTSCKVQSKVDNYLKSKALEEYNVEDILKKKELLNQKQLEKEEKEKEEKERKNRENTRSYTYKRTVSSKKNCTHKK